MISWLLGSQAPPWYYLRDIFSDYRNAGIYINNKNEIEIIKVSDLDDFFIPTSVLLHAKYLKELKPYYIKLEKYVAFPIFDINAIKILIQGKGWRSIEYYYCDNFIGGWVLYDCTNCEEKQMLHLQVSRDLGTEDLVKAHLKIYNS
ncbi:hypothetical protein [Acidianus brierleyi]|uniref:Uncharacterized protein n=1 Tax=Acidianus brierleyi TaxID=41673 RepID=A0A2U9IC36_9CREN|nr:hypothetical protein [Acidianus brierleyi]AWR93554.1 hypothetical protein DFR85_01930 [Acidianus brierleyi]